MKRLLITVFLLTLSIFNCFAQTLTREQKIQQAINDVQKFELNKVDFKKFRQDRANYLPANLSPGGRRRADLLKIQNIRSEYTKGRDSIDYFTVWFMPTRTTTADSTLLRDSTYVQYYRAAAYQKTAARRTIGHTLLIAGIIVGGVAAIVGIVAVVVAIGNASTTVAKAFIPKN